MTEAEEMRATESRHRPGGPCTRVSRNGNGAVSALFRVFGGSGKEKRADGFERTPFGAMHAGERLWLGTIFTLSVFAAISEWLVQWCGMIAGWLLVLPVSFLLLNLAAFVVPGTKPRTQWWVWLSLFTAWGWWRKDAGGYVGAFAWLWLGIAALNVICFLILCLGRTMKIKGWPGAFWRLGLFVLLHLIAFVDHWFWGWTWAIGGGLGISLLCCLAILRPGCQWLGPVRVLNEGRGVLVTIDDGPDPHDTPKLLDLLDQYGMKAVFFVIGEKVRKHPDLVREILRRGHDLGNHTMTHPQATFWCAGPWRTRREILECQKVVEEATGTKPRYFRAPVGHRNLFTHPFAEEVGLEIIGWNRRGYDAVEKDPDVVLRKILPLSHGDIVLIHESTPIAVPVLKGVLDAVDVLNRKSAVG